MGTAYNQHQVEKGVWSVSDLPRDWPGRRIAEEHGVNSTQFANAVWEFQLENGLTVDGKLGPATLAVLKGAFMPADAVIARVGRLEFLPPKTKTASPRDQVASGNTPAEKVITRLWNRYGGEIARQAFSMDVPVTTALAVMAVESKQAYDPRTSLVIIRYEDHVFRDGTGVQVIARRGGQVAEWDNLQRAAAVNLREAIKATSWGLPQLMGFNWQCSRFETPEDMAIGFQDSCVEQIGGFFGYIKKARLIWHIKRREWRAFTRGYNGPGQVEHYSKKLVNYLAVIDRLERRGVRFAG